MPAAEEGGGLTAHQWYPLRLVCQMVRVHRDSQEV
jgi:hypothetical protein